MKTIRINMITKVILLQFTFLLLHYLYEWFPNGVTAIVSATDESIYQHMKVAFFSYILVSLFEYIWFRKQIESRGKFIHARALTAVLFSLLVIVWYYTSCAYFVKFDNLFLEILFANIATILTSITGLHLEQHLEQVDFSLGMKRLSIAVFVVKLSEFIIFTHRLPWLDVFANPPGW
ncbi:MAG: DUF6512 family protein [Chloroflexota bacterium]